MKIIYKIRLVVNHKILALTLSLTVKSDLAGMFFQGQQGC